VNVPSNWWETFFEGAIVDLWRQALPPAYTQGEADRLERFLAVARGADLIDVPCGAGRLSLVLAERGYRMTGVDWSSEFLGHARTSAGGDAVAWERRDMRDLPWQDRFDGAFCVGNSFGYLDDAGNLAFLRATHAALKRGARFVLETPMVIENLLGHLQPRPWWKAGDICLLVENSYDAARSRLDIEYTVLIDGRLEVRRGSHRAYSYRELTDLIASAGFDVMPAEPWTREAHWAWFVATRR